MAVFVVGLMALVFAFAWFGMPFGLSLEAMALIGVGVWYLARPMIQKNLRRARISALVHTFRGRPVQVLLEGGTEPIIGTLDLNEGYLKIRTEEEEDVWIPLSRVDNAVFRS